jgi:anthranilate synthase component I
MESLAATPALSPSRFAARPRPAPAAAAAAGTVRIGAMVAAGRRGRLSAGGGVRCYAGAPRTNAVVSRSAVAAEEDRRRFFEAAARGNLVPIWECIVSDHLTPVLAYRCLVPEDDVDAPSFLFESVEQGPEGTTNVVRPPSPNP